MIPCFVMLAMVFRFCRRALRRLSGLSEGELVVCRAEVSGGNAAVDEALRLDPKLVPASDVEGQARHGDGSVRGRAAELGRALAVDPKAQYAQFLYGMVRTSRTTCKQRCAVPESRMS